MDQPNPEPNRLSTARGSWRRPSLTFVRFSLAAALLGLAGWIRFRDQTPLWLVAGDETPLRFTPDSRSIWFGEKREHEWMLIRRATLTGEIVETRSISLPETPPPDDLSMNDRCERVTVTTRSRTAPSIRVVGLTENWERSFDVVDDWPRVPEPFDRCVRLRPPPFRRRATNVKTNECVVEVIDVKSERLAATVRTPTIDRSEPSGFSVAIAESADQILVIEQDHGNDRTYARVFRFTTGDLVHQAELPFRGLWGVLHFDGSRALLIEESSDWRENPIPCLYARVDEGRFSPVRRFDASYVGASSEIAAAPWSRRSGGVALSYGKRLLVFAEEEVVSSGSPALLEQWYRYLFYTVRHRTGVIDIETGEVDLGDPSTSFFGYVDSPDGRFLAGESVRKPTAPWPLGEWSNAQYVRSIGVVSTEPLDRRPARWLALLALPVVFPVATIAGLLRRFAGRFRRPNKTNVV
jgi:hypothetical protein